MARPAKFTSSDILDAAARLIARGGPRLATVSTIAEDLGAPTGSIYHRFASRELLLARLWIRTIRRAQAGFLEALAIQDLNQAARTAATHIPRWSREHLDEARVLLLYRRADLAARWPDELGQELATLNVQVEQALREFTRRRYGRLTASNLQRVTFALVDVPYAAARRYLLAGEPPPTGVDALVAQACACILDEHAMTGRSGSRHGG
jgi:AcrR family transcriptional regulator